MWGGHGTRAGRPLVVLPAEYGAQPVRRRPFSPPGSVYIKAAEGCDNRCSFCASPSSAAGSAAGKWMKSSGK